MVCLEALLFRSYPCPIRQVSSHEFGAVQLRVLKEIIPRPRALQRREAKGCRDGDRSTGEALSWNHRTSRGSGSCDTYDIRALHRNWQGSIEGWSITTQTFMMRMSKSLPGLNDFYMAGQWVEPGGGVPAAALSGRNIIQIICKRDKKPFITRIP